MVDDTVEQIVPVDPGYSNADLKAPMREIAQETPPEVVEPAKEEPEVVPVVEDEGPSLDEVGTEIAKKTAQQILDEQEARRIATEEAAKPQEDEYAEWEKELWEKEKRTPTYKEALDFVKQQAINAIKEEQANQIKQKQEEETKVREAQEAQKKQINAFVDIELNEAYNRGLLTKIKDPYNPSDQGVVERQSLFKAWKEVNDKRRAEGKPEIISATYIMNYHWKKPNVQPAGANAPIAGNRASSTPPVQSQEYSYNDIKKPWSFFKRG